MRIYSLSKVIGAPLAVAFIFLIFYVFVHGHSDALIWGLPVLMLLVAVYIFSPQIDYWWHERYPPGLDQHIQNWLLTYSGFYQTLNVAERRKFDTRLSIFLAGKEFKGMGQEQSEMPDDIKAVIAHQAIIMTFGLEEYTFGQYDRFVTYKHPFPTPKKQFLHTVEVEHEDGMILLALDHLIPGITHPSQYYNIVMHAFAEAFVIQNPKLDYPSVSDHTPRALEQISGFSIEQIKAVIGHDHFDLLSVMINYYFCFSDRFSQILSTESQSLDQVFHPSQD